MINLCSRVFLVILLLVIENTIASEYKNISGETNYIKHKNESLVSTINSEYSIPFYTSPCESWALTIGGKLSFDFDHFSNEIKTNAFTTIGLEF
jgi:hypothetical protein